MAENPKRSDQLDAKAFDDLQLTDEVLGNDYESDGTTIKGTMRAKLRDLLRKGIVPLDAPAATVNTANTVSTVGPVLGQTTDGALCVRFTQTAGLADWIPLATAAATAAKNDKTIVFDVANPQTAPGVAAAVGVFGISTDSRLWYKSGESDTAWLPSSFKYEIVESDPTQAPGLSRFPGDFCRVLATGATFFKHGAGATDWTRIDNEVTAAQLAAKADAADLTAFAADPTSNGSFDAGAWVSALPGSSSPIDTPSLEYVGVMLTAGGTTGNAGESSLAGFWPGNIVFTGNLPAAAKIVAGEKWRMYYSTDHASTSGKVRCAYTTEGNLERAVLNNTWIEHNINLVESADLTDGVDQWGFEPETPFVWLTEDGAFRMALHYILLDTHPDYVTVNSIGQNALYGNNQTTGLFTSTDGLSWTFSRIWLDVPTVTFHTGDRHTGYGQRFFFEGRPYWIGLSGGSDKFGSAIYDENGGSPQMMQFRMGPDRRWFKHLENTQRHECAPFRWKDGYYWQILRKYAGYASGGGNVGGPLIACRLTSDLVQIAAAPVEVVDGADIQTGGDLGFGTMLQAAGQTYMVRYFVRDSDSAKQLLLFKVN